MKLTVCAALLSLGLLLTGCGKESSSAKADTQGGGAANIHITGNDQMKYDVTAFTVHPGQEVHLTFQNKGTLPINTMGHDLVILNSGENYQTFGGEVATNGGSLDNGYLPSALSNRVFAHTKVLGPGEKQTITFTAPAAGEYPYLCTFPGHFVLMHGVMTVK